MIETIVQGIVGGLAFAGANSLIDRLRVRGIALEAVVDSVGDDRRGFADGLFCDAIRQPEKGDS